MTCRTNVEATWFHLFLKLKKTKTKKKKVSKFVTLNFLRSDVLFIHHPMNSRCPHSLKLCDSHISCQCISLQWNSLTKHIHRLAQHNPNTTLSLLGFLWIKARFKTCSFTFSVPAWTSGLIFSFDSWQIIIYQTKTVVHHTFPLLWLVVAVAICISWHPLKLRNELWGFETDSHCRLVWQCQGRAIKSERA